MIADALRRTMLRTPEEALQAALAAAKRRFQSFNGEPVKVVHIDGKQRGTIKRIAIDSGVVRLIIATEDNRELSELPGYWSRSSL